MTGFEEIITQNKGELITIFTGIIGIAVGIFIATHIPNIKNLITLKNLSRWSIILFIIGVLGIIAAFWFGRTPPTPLKIVEEKPIQEVKPEKPIDFDKFIELLENEPSTHKRLTLLSKHSEIIPNQISATDLKRILERFYSNDRRLEVVKILQNLYKLKNSYTESERSEIKGMFNNYIWYTEGEKLFNGSQ